METVTVYWRPRCPYCARLRRDLRALGVPAREVNIWADESAAAAVRELVGGNETVPTVVIGGRGYVNPPASAVLAEVRRADSGFAPDQHLARAGRRRRLRLLRVTQWVVTGGLIVASFAVESAGQAGLSWGRDGQRLISALRVRSSGASFGIGAGHPSPAGPAVPADVHVSARALAAPRPGEPIPTASGRPSPAGRPRTRRRWSPRRGSIHLLPGADSAAGPCAR